MKRYVEALDKQRNICMGNKEKTLPASMAERVFCASLSSVYTDSAGIEDVAGIEDISGIEH